MQYQNRQLVLTGSMAVQEATVLSRSAKEHERRKGEKEGFSKAPGDCLAFKYYRDVRHLT